MKKTTFKAHYHFIYPCKVVLVDMEYHHQHKLRLPRKENRRNVGEAYY